MGFSTPQAQHIMFLILGQTGPPWSSSPQGLHSCLCKEQIFLPQLLQRAWKVLVVLWWSRGGGRGGMVCWGPKINRST